MITSRTVAGLAGHAVHELRLIEIAAHARSGRVAGKAAVNLGASYLAFHCVVDVDIGGQGAARSEMKCSKRTEVGHASLVEFAIFLLEEIGLGNTVGPEGPGQRRGLCTESVDHGINACAICGSNAVAVELIGEAEISVRLQNVGFAGCHRGIRH